MTYRLYLLGTLLVLASLLFAACGTHVSTARLPIDSGMVDSRIGVSRGQLTRLNASIDSTEASMRRLEQLNRGPQKVSKQQVERIKTDVNRSYDEFADAIGNVEGSLTLARSTLQERIRRLDPKKAEDKAAIEDLEKTLNRLDKYLIITDQARQGVRRRSFSLLDSLETAFLVSGYAAGPWGLVGSLAFSFIRGIIGKKTKRPSRKHRKA